MKRALLSIATTFLLLTAVACGNDDEALRQEVTEEMGGELDTSMTQVMDEQDEPEVQVGHSAAVVIDENTIGIEAVLEPVPTVFTIRNSGLNEHSFAIQGPGVDARIEAALPPEGTDSLEVTLQEGTYRVFDPMNETLSTTVTVGSGSAATTGTE